MIKIAFVIDSIESPTAGTEKQLLMLIKHLDRAKFLPYLCVLRSSEWLKNDFHDCEVIEIGVRSFFNPSSYLHILRFAYFLRKQQVNIVQTYFNDANKCGILAAKFAKTPVVVSARRNQGYWHTRFELLMLKILNRWVTCFLANAESTRQWAAKQEGIALNKIRVIHNSIEVERYYRANETQRREFRVEHGFPENAVIVGSVANLRPVKAIDVFLEAAKLVVQEKPEVYFVVVGSGPEQEKLERFVRHLGIANNVRFVGSRTDIPELLSCMDIGVLSSSSESFSNAIVEYMAAGLAVVCTDVGGAREAVEDGITGYLVKSGDTASMAEKILNVIKQQKYQVLGENGRKKCVGSFSHQEIFRKYQECYEEQQK